MNKKLNTLLFILGGTLVNLIFAIIGIGGLLLLVGQLTPFLGEKVAGLVPFAFVGGILLAMIAYQKLTRWVIERFNLSDKLSPLFTIRHKKPNRD